MNTELTLLTDQLTTRFMKLDFTMHIQEPAGIACETIVHVLKECTGRKSKAEADRLSTVLGKLNVCEAILDLERIPDRELRKLIHKSQRITKKLRDAAYRY